MNIKIIATLMAFILGTLILLSRSWSKRERATHELEAMYAQELLKNSGKSIEELDHILAEAHLNELALKLASAKGRSEETAKATLRSDLSHILSQA